jgi:hypothetical protein
MELNRYNKTRAWYTCPGIFFKVALTFAACFIMQSCFEEIDVEIPSLKEEARLIIYGVLTTNNDVSVSIARTFPPSTDKTITVRDIYITNADVFIYNQEWNDSIQLKQIHDTTSIYYCSKNDITIEEGQSYEIYVSANGYPPVHAKTKIPINAPEWKTWRLMESQVDLDGEFTGGYTFYGEWEIPPDEKQQFISISNKSIYSTGDENWTFYNFIEYDLNYKIKNDVAIYESQPFTIQNEKTEFGHDIERTVSLVTADDHLYEYITNYLLLNDISYALDTDSFLELFRGILPEYTNIEGGFGIFGSYSEHTITIYKNDEPKYK